MIHNIYQYHYVPEQSSVAMIAIFATFSAVISRRQNIIFSVNYMRKKYVLHEIKIYVDFKRYRFLCSDTEGCIPPIGSISNQIQPIYWATGKI